MPRMISGALPWAGASAAGNLPLGGDPASLAASYSAAYNSALAMNQANYQNILQGYQQTMRGQQRAFGGIQRGYGRLTSAVLGDIEGAGEAQQQEITDQYARASGTALQNLASAGLGNTTVTSAVQRGLTLDQAKAETDLASRMAALTAGYRSSLGQAGLGFRTQAAMANAQLAQSQLQWMNTVQAQYPDPGLYAQLAQQYGLQQASEQGLPGVMYPQGGGVSGTLGYASPRPYQAPSGGGDISGMPGGEIYGSGPNRGLSTAMYPSGGMIYGGGGVNPGYTSAYNPYSGGLGAAAGGLGIVAGAYAAPGIGDYLGGFGFE